VNPWANSFNSPTHGGLGQVRIFLAP